MGTERWHRVEELFLRAAELPEEEREAFLDTNAGDDLQTRREVESLLGADSLAEEFLEQPLFARDAEVDRLHGAVSGRLGHYRLIRDLGEGGMSRLYLAVRDDDEYQKLVALKVVRRGMDSPELRRRFRAERQILAAMDHPNIAKLLDGGTTESGLPYFVMDYIEGVRIDEYCDQNRLGIPERLKLFLEVCAALSYAHQNLVVHRDIKPGNILVTPDGMAKLLDFGIAKPLRPEQSIVPFEMTSTFMRPMTPYYASPEQILRKRIATPSDIYSLGVLLYRLLCGRFPYRVMGLTAQAVEHAVLSEPAEKASSAIRREAKPSDSDDLGPKPPSAEEIAHSRGTSPRGLERQLTGDLDNIVMMALRKEPQRRYSSVGLFAEDVRRHLNGLPVLAHKDSLGYRTGKFFKRNRAAVTAAVAFAVLLIAFAATMAIQATRIAHERDQAQRERDRAKSVAQFLQDSFRLSDPLHGGGESITARQILDHGADRVMHELGDQPEIQATLLDAIGSVYVNLGFFDLAEPLLRKALGLRRAVLGEKHADVAQSLNRLGTMLREQGKLESAQENLEDALAMRRELLGEEHREVGDTLYQLARLNDILGDFARAVELYKEAIRLESAASPSGSLRLASQLSYQAIALTQLGDFEAAEPMFREALDLRRRLLGERHPLVATNINDLAVLLGIMQDFAAAEPLFRESLALRRATLGDSHPDVAESINNLGRLAREMGKNEEAEGYYREALAIETARLGRDHHEVGILLTNLGLLLRDMGQLEEAEELLREALQTRLRKVGETHPETGVTMSAIGSVMVAAGRADEAEGLLRRGLEIVEREMPPGHWRYGEAQGYLGECLVELGRLDEAEPLLVASFQTLRDKRGLDNRRTLAALHRLVGFYERIGRPEEAAIYRLQAAD